MVRCVGEVCLTPSDTLKPLTASFTDLKLQKQPVSCSEAGALLSLAIAEAEEVEVVARVLGHAARFERFADERIHHAHRVRLEPQDLLHRSALWVA